MKKIGTILIRLLTIIAGMWFYLANKFKKIATGEVLPKIKESNSTMQVDLSSVAIEKFKFKLTLKGVTIFPEESTYFKIKSDEITISYNPFTDNICTRFNGKKLSIGTGGTGIYIPNPNQIIEFNRSILKQGLSDVTLKTTSKKIFIYLATADKFISRATGSKFKFSNNLNSDKFYSIKLALDFNNVEIKPESKYLINLLENLIPKSAQEKLTLNKNNIQIVNYYCNIVKKTDPVNYNAKHSIKLGKQHVDNIIASIRGEKELSEIYDKFNFTEDNYSLKAKKRTNNFALDDSSSFFFSGDGKKIVANTNAVLKRSYIDEQKKAVTNITSILLKTSAIDILNTLNIDLNVMDEDFKKLAEVFTNFKKVIINFDINYDITSSNLNHSLNMRIDNFSTSVTGAVENEIYSGQATVSTPAILINNIFSTYEDAIKPFLEKVISKIDDLRLNSLNQLMNNIKNNTFDALAVFYKGDELKMDDSLVTNITVNPKGIDFKINNKDFFKSLTDERIVKFLKKIPEKNFYGR